MRSVASGVTDPVAQDGRGGFHTGSPGRFGEGTLRTTDLSMRPPALVGCGITPPRSPATYAPKPFRATANSRRFASSTCGYASFRSVIACTTAATTTARVNHL